IAVINKSDVEQRLDADKIAEKNIQIVYLSAKENDGIDMLRQAIEKEFQLNEIDFDNISAANERQKKCIDSSLKCVRDAIIAIKSGELLDAVTVLIDEAEQFLLELTGEKTTDAVVDEVFSRFCVGK
ncbi:MAG: tRNA uridine-5-carboxymethylaminomethyl(34) synthesis GTPase MnmE, partial [Ruminococcus sp.]|nr:tRNA uridine-5-carboxymethylaminomethyl(34) synthesis GTPase MnmE [Ruminococcus sp.]